MSRFLAEDPRVANPGLVRRKPRRRRSPPQPDRRADCVCSEGSHPLAPRAHSCAYVARRNSFVDRAVDAANGMVPNINGRRNRAWNVAFSAAMEMFMAQSGKG